MRGRIMRGTRQVLELGYTKVVVVSVKPAELACHSRDPKLGRGLSDLVSAIYLIERTIRNTRTKTGTYLASVVHVTRKMARISNPAQLGIHKAICK